MVNERTIAIVSIIVIISSLGYSSLNLLSANSVQFKWAAKNFDFLSVTYGRSLEACNPSDYPTIFTKYTFAMSYDSRPLGAFTTSGMSILPHSKANVNGKFTTNDEQVPQILFSFLDTKIQGTDVIRIDANKMKILTTLDYTIIGVIPLSISHQYSGQEFLKMMNENTRC